MRFALALFLMLSVPVFAGEPIVGTFRSSFTSQMSLTFSSNGRGFWQQSNDSPRLYFKYTRRAEEDRWPEYNLRSEEDDSIIAIIRMSSDQGVVDKNKIFTNSVMMDNLHYYERIR